MEQSSGHTESGTVDAMLDGNVGRMGRYVVVSLVNVINHQLLLFVAVTWWGWSGGVGNTFAALTASIPAYFMSRQWVWQVKGRSSLRAEVAPFWIISLVGLVVSTALAEGADRMFDADVMILVGSLTGYFLVWLAKFLLLHKIFARPSEVVEAAESHLHPGD